MHVLAHIMSHMHTHTPREKKNSTGRLHFCLPLCRDVTDSIICSVDICGNVLAKPVPFSAPQGLAVVKFASERLCSPLNHMTLRSSSIIVLREPHIGKFLCRRFADTE